MKKYKAKMIFKSNIWWMISIILIIITVFVDHHFNVNIITIDSNPKNYLLGFRISDLTLTLLGGIVTLIAYSVRQRQKLVAEQVAKSRIEWLKITREYVGDYMSKVNQGWFLLHSKSNYEKKDINKVQMETEQLYYRVIYSFNPNEDISTLLKYYYIVSSSMYNVDNGDKKYFTTIVGKSVQAYFKKEWDKAKLEIQYGITFKSNDDKSGELSRVLNEIDKGSGNPIIINGKNTTSFSEDGLNYKFVEFYSRFMSKQKQFVYK